jgi:plasmanylethanolamine desaturase
MSDAEAGKGAAPSVAWSQHRLLEAGAIALFAMLTGIVIVRVVLSMAATPTPLRAVIIPVAMLLGYLVADLLSGLVHWIFDTWWTETTPVIGQSFVRPFREHHTDPESITRHDWVETNGNNSLASLPILVVACVQQLSTTRGLFVSMFMLSTALGILATNQFHKWAHESDPGRVVRLLQRWHLILPADHHRLHHTSPYDTHYCITTGWFNGILAEAGVFRRIERAIALTHPFWRKS